ncbi:MAG TPA: cyclic peptide export ABC transporter, partial [Pyrinomonadaceae bacterium]
LLAAVAVAIVVGVVSYQLPIMKATQYFGRAREEEDQLFGHFRALVDGFKELKMHGGRRRSFVSEQLEPTAASFRDNNVMGMAIYSVAANWGQLLVFIVIGLLIFLMPQLVGVNAPALTGFTIAILYITTPLQVIMNAVPELGRASVALDKIEQLGISLVSDAGAERADAAPPALAGSGEGDRLSLEAVDVTHTYYVEGDANNFTLGPVDLSFRAGEVVFLTGGNGSGKTTFAKLLTGLYEPEGGEVRLNGRPVTAETRAAYRQLFSVVFADFFLFDSLLGLESHELDARAREYLSQLQLAHKVQVADRKLSTTKLSQGQRKRLALLTAYLEDRPVYLFDEWAADQDPVFKEVFYLRLLPELKARGKTVFVISHDDHYYFVADRVIKFDYGKVESDMRGAAGAGGSARYAANGGVGGVVAGAQDLA